MPASPRVVRIDESSTSGLREADAEVWAQAFGTLDRLSLPDGEVGAELAALRDAVSRLRLVEGNATVRSRQARRVWRPGQVAGGTLVLAGALALAGAATGTPWVQHELASAVIGLGLLATGVSWAAHRALGRPSRVGEARAAALVALERLARRTFVTTAGELVVAGRGYQRALRTAREAARASVDAATERAREADATLAWARAANLRQAKPAEDAETTAIASLRQRLLSEVQGAQIALAELERRLTRIDARFEELVAAAGRRPVPERSLPPERRGAPPPAIDAGLAELEADVGALVALVDDARGRLDQAVAASAQRVEALIRSRRES